MAGDLLHLGRVKSLRCQYITPRLSARWVDCYNDYMEYNNPDPRDPAHNSSRDSNSDPSFEPFPDEDAWVTDEEIQALNAERDVMGTTIEMQAESILKENLPQIVQSVVKLARSAQSETVRLGAAKYIIDRNLGRISEPTSDEGDKLHDFMKDIVGVGSVNASANTPQGSDDAE